MNRRALIWLAASAALALAPAAYAQAQPAVAAVSLQAPAQAQARAETGQRWSEAKAKAWYAQQPWLVGANYTTSTAINQLEMFQAETFDPVTIDRELRWAREKFGMNTMRVYLHDLLWEQDPEGFKRRLDQFLTIAAKHDIKPMLVLFDSCWDPDPVLGPQHRPIPGVHNSGWVQSPSRKDLVDPAKDVRFRAYVEGVIGAFANDSRVLAWDLWNEPDNSGGGSYEDDQMAQEKQRIAELMPQIFDWARAARPTQPLTSGVWIGPDWSPGAKTLTPMQRTQLEQSDVITFHSYDQPEIFEDRIRQLRGYNRPLICTEWLARGNGSNVDTILPIARRENVGMINWGFVDGKIQTRFPWDSWDRPYTLKEPTVWFHDLLHADGRPYRQREVELFQAAGGRKKGASGGR